MLQSLRRTWYFFFYFEISDDGFPFLESRESGPSVYEWETLFQIDKNRNLGWLLGSWEFGLGFISRNLELGAGYHLQKFKASFHS